MNITIFKDITTTEYINELKTESEKYTGLYVDMNHPEQRKYVKDKGSLIAGLIKKIERKRIDVTREFKINTDNEAASIIEDLKIANLPFDLLLDEYKAERKKILDDEKARKQAIIDAEQYELDHEMAILINKTFEYDREQEKKAQKDLESKLRIEAERKAKERQKLLDEAEIQSAINAKNKRLADVEHVRGVNNVILNALMGAGFSSCDSKNIIKLIVSCEIPNITINY